MSWHILVGTLIVHSPYLQDMSTEKFPLLTGNPSQQGVGGEEARVRLTGEA